MKTVVNFFNEEFYATVKTIYRAIVLSWLVISCKGSPVQPPDFMAGTWCPIDSLTAYVFEHPVGLINLTYVKGINPYKLVFDGYGHVKSDGVYEGIFLNVIDSSTFESNFILPLQGIEGSYEIGEAYLRFYWPYPEAGPTWFWEIARHPIFGKDWATQLDYNDLNFRIYLRFSWERC